MNYAHITFQLYRELQCLQRNWLDYIHSTQKSKLGWTLLYKIFAKTWLLQLWTCCLYTPWEGQSIRQKRSWQICFWSFSQDSRLKRVSSHVSTISLSFKTDEPTACIVRVHVCNNDDKHNPSSDFDRNCTRLYCCDPRTHNVAPWVRSGLMILKYSPAS